VSGIVDDALHLAEQRRKGVWCGQQAEQRGKKQRTGRLSKHDRYSSKVL
jgi:hypothetical protein